MRECRDQESGESLLEILIAIVLIGLSMSVLFYAFTTSTSASTTNQDLVTANGVLRAYAETTKAAVKNSCPGGNFTATYAPADNRFTVSPSPLTQACPSTTSPATVTLTVTLPNSEGSRSLDIMLRSS